MRQDLLVMRAEAARSDSARRSQVDQVGRELAELSVFTDSLRNLSARLTRLQGDLQSRLFAIDQQLLQVQELSGQSQRRLTELRASLEERGAGVAGASDPAASGNPGPNQLLVLARQQLARGSATSARQAFQDLLAQSPSPDVAGEAQYWLGESFAAEGDTAQAIGAFQATAARYPRGPKTSTALYKHGLILLAQGKRAEARALLNRVVSQYPSSEEASLARDRLKTIR